jgi:hypothetical protein
VFDSIRDLSDLVPDLDFTNTFGPVVAAMEPLTHLHSEIVRDDESGRKEASKSADRILTILGSIA